MKVLSYLRVSTRGQGDEDKLGLDRQRELLDIWLAANPEYTEVDEVRDVGFSGASADRPGLAQILALTNADIDAVLVPCWDRLARDVMLDGFIRYTLNERGIKVISATQDSGDDPTSVMVQGILAAVAGYERHLIAARLAGARRLKASRGGYAHGQPNYGFEVDGQGGLRVNLGEIRTLQLIESMRSQRHSWHSIARFLNMSGVKAKHGGPWWASSVKSACDAVNNPHRHPVASKLYKSVAPIGTAV